MSNSPTPNKDSDLLKQTALKWRIEGLNIRPVLIDRFDPVEHKWIKNFNKWGSYKDLHTREQTVEEFEAIPFTEINGIALMLSRPLLSGLWLGVLDFDFKNQPAEAVKLGKTILEELKIQYPTQEETTINEGNHLYYLSTIPPRYVNKYRDNSCIELLGGERLCVCAPTLNYTITNPDTSIVHVENIEAIFEDLMKKHNVLANTAKKEEKLQNSTPTTTINTSIRPCVTQVLNNQLAGDLGHSMRLAIAAEYLNKGKTVEETVKVFEGQSDFDYSTTLTQVQSVNGKLPHKCSSIKEYGYCLYGLDQTQCSWRSQSGNKQTKREEEKEKEKEKEVKMSFGFASSNVIIEQCCDEQGKYYAVYNREIKTISRLASFEIKNVITYVPVTLDKDKRLWNLCTSPKDYGSIEQLYHAIRGYLYDHIDFVEDLDYDVLTTLVMATWKLEDWEVVPYIILLGPPSCGKTRVLECVQQLGYRPLLTSSISPAALYRIIEEYHPTLLLDESETFANKDKNPEINAILNSGYKKGQVAVRSGTDENGFTPEVFDVYGFKVISGTKSLSETLSSRSIILTMSKASRRVKIFTDKETSKGIRGQLLKYRFETLGTVNPTLAQAFLDTHPDFNNGRVLEIYHPLLQTSPTEEIRKKIESHLTNTSEDKDNSAAVSIEAVVLQAFVDCEPKKDQLNRVKTCDVTAKINEGFERERDKWNDDRTGRKLRDLGLRSCGKIDSKNRGFYYEVGKISRLKKKFLILTENKTSTTFQGSGTSGTNALKEFVLVNNSQNRVEFCSTSDHQAEQQAEQNEITQTTQTTTYTKNTIGAYWPVPSNVKCDVCFHGVEEPARMWCVRMPDNTTSFRCDTALNKVIKAFLHIAFQEIPNPFSP